ncbi:hypothetical protein M8J77_005026 [Diaphorina citri]|nr:hypothetical protein M8J77_005026 [Diaphorina citri]
MKPRKGTPPRRDLSGDTLITFPPFVERAVGLQSLVNGVDQNGELVLDIALRDKQIGIAETLIKHKADVNARDSQGWSLLLKSTNRGRSGGIV